MENLRNEIVAILDLIKDRKYTEAQKLFAEYYEDIKGFIVFLGENGIISPEDIRDLSENMVKAIENSDYYRLEDLLQYAILSVYDQVFAEETEDEE